MAMAGQRFAAIREVSAGRNDQSAPAQQAVTMTEGLPANTNCWIADLSLNPRRPPNLEG